MKAGAKALSLRKPKDRFSKYKIHKKPGQKSERQRLTLALDTVFKLWVRLSNSDLNGIVKCYTCGKIKHYKDNIHGGHYIGCEKKPTRWHTKNVKPQCSHCNTTGQGQSEWFARNLDKEYGKGTADMIKVLSHGYYKFDAFKVKELIKHYRAEVKKLKLERGID